MNSGVSLCRKPLLSGNVELIGLGSHGIQFTEVTMYYVGLDIHSKHISVCVLNEVGKFLHRTRVRTIDEMMRILERLTDRFEVCYEASCGYGHFHDLLRPVAARVPVGPSPQPFGCDTNYPYIERWGIEDARSSWSHFP